MYLLAQKSFNVQDAESFMHCDKINFMNFSTILRQDHPDLWETF